MKADLRTTFLLTGEGGKLEIEDITSGSILCKIKFSPKQVCQMFGRLACVKSESAEVYNLEKIGKKLEIDTLEFKMPKHTWENTEEIATKEAFKLCPTGWKPDIYFNSQNSFFLRLDILDIQWARCTIRRWVVV